eukprot:2283502-Rhodomonas_salina.5
MQLLPGQYTQYGDRVAFEFISPSRPPTAHRRPTRSRPPAPGGLTGTAPAQIKGISAPNQRHFSALSAQRQTRDLILQFIPHRGAGGGP